MSNMNDLIDRHVDGMSDEVVRLSLKLALREQAKTSMVIANLRGEWFGNDEAPAIGQRALIAIPAIADIDGWAGKVHWIVLSPDGRDTGTRVGRLAVTMWKPGGEE
jgi:hypothetical protein